MDFIIIMILSIIFAASVTVTFVIGCLIMDWAQKPLRDAEEKEHTQRILRKKL